MTCIPTDRLLQSLRVQAPGTTDAMLNLQIFNVVDEFLRRTSAWKQEDEITLEENERQYSIPIPAGTALIRVMGVTHNGVPVASASSGGVLQHSMGRLAPEMVFPDGDATYEPSETDLDAGLFSYAIYAPDYISITTAPDAEAVKFPLKVVTALSLGSTCVECDCGDWAIPEWMWDMYFQSWLDGVLGRLFTMPAKPWSNKTQAVYHNKRFRNSMAFHKQEARRGFSYNVPAWRFPRGWV